MSKIDTVMAEYREYMQSRRLAKAKHILKWTPIFGPGAGGNVP